MSNTLNLGDGKWAAKEGSLLAYNSENGNFKPLPFTFDRSTSATRVNKQGLIEVVSNNEPRIDFLNDSKGALLLEPSRSNLVTHSEDTTEWDKNETPINTSNTTISPNGSRNADSVIVDSISEGFYDFSVGTVQSGTSYTFSIFIKYISGVETIRFGGSGGGFGGDNNNVFNIKNGTVVSAVSGNTLSVNDYGNGWYRLIATKTASSTATAAWILYGNENAEIQYSAWGVQVEQGSYATSYIPTQGGVVTRLAESCSQTPPSGIIGQTEGTMFIEIGKKITPSIALFECGQGSSQHRFFVYTDASSKLKVLVVNNYAVQVNYTSTVNVESNAKIAIGYANNNYAIYLNGSLLVTDTSATVPPMNQIAIASDRGTIVTASNQIKETKLYNTRLSNSELQALTSN